MSNDTDFLHSIQLLRAISSGGIGGFAENCGTALSRLCDPAAVKVLVVFPGLSTQVFESGGGRYRDFLDDHLKSHGFDIDNGAVKGSGSMIVTTETEEIVCISAIRHINNTLGYIAAVTPLQETGAVPLADGISLVLPQIESRIVAFLRPGGRSSLELTARRLIEELNGIGVNGVCIKPSVPDHIVVSVAVKEHVAGLCRIDELSFSEHIEAGTILDKGECESLWPGVNNIETGIWLSDPQDRLIAFGFSDKKLLNKNARERLDKRLESLENGDIDYIIKSFEKLKKEFKKMVNAERAAAVTETAVTVNHEINNPLTAILGNTQLLLMNKEKLSKEAITKLETIEKSATQIREVTNQLMNIIEPVRKQYASGLEMIDVEKSRKKPDKD